jgi:hypothetical protein
VENYQDYQLQQQQNYRLDKDMLMDKTKQKRKLIFTFFYFNKYMHAKGMGRKNIKPDLMREIIFHNI